MSQLISFQAPGNHEYDDHVAGFVPFLENISFPVVAANIDASEEPTIKDLIPKSVTVQIGGRRVGIIGYVTSDTPVSISAKSSSRSKSQRHIM
jgi:2',3'-cyclic-nucleotide 2'-phosphodiesterase (5'-nucleotidase family)